MGKNWDFLTPTTDDVPAFCQKTTLVKTRIQGTVDFFKSKEIKTKKEAIFYYNKIFLIIKFKILMLNNLYTFKNDPIKKKIYKYKICISF